MRRLGLGAELDSRVRDPPGLQSSWRWFVSWDMAEERLRVAVRRFHGNRRNEEGSYEHGRPRSSDSRSYWLITAAQATQHRGCLALISALDVRNPPASKTFHRCAGRASPAGADRSWRTRSVDCADPRRHLYLPRARGPGGPQRFRTRR